MYKLFLSARSSSKTKSGSNNNNKNNDNDNNNNNGEEPDVAAKKDCDDDYTENGIPFAVTVHDSFLWGDDECSALEGEDEGEFERLWAQLDLQQQQQQQQPRIQPHQLYGLPPWMCQQQQQQQQEPRRLFPSILPQHHRHQQQHHPSFAATHQIVSDEEEREENEEEKRQEGENEEQNHSISNTGVATILSELTAMERTNNLPLERAKKTDKTDQPQPAFERWSIHDEEGERMEEYLIPEETSCMTPVDTCTTTDRKEVSSSQECSLSSPTSYDNRTGGDMDMNGSVPTDITPPPLPNRPTTPAAVPHHRPAPTLLVRQEPITPRSSTPATTTSTAATRPVRNLTTTTTTSNSRGNNHDDDEKNRSSCHWSERAKYITATIIKPSKKTQLGLDLRTTSQGAVEISHISKDGFLFVSGVPLQVGDFILGITTDYHDILGDNNHNNQNTNGMRKQDMVRILQRTVGPLTIVALNPTGNPTRFESMTVKPHPEYGTGIFFVSGAAAAPHLQIHSVPRNGLFAHSCWISAGDQVLSINGVDCSMVDASVATDIVKSAPRFVSIVTQTTANNNHGNDGVTKREHATTSSVGNSVLEPTNHPVAQEQSNLTTVPEGGERRMSFGLFRRRSPTS
jgi:hypothetical protein